MAVMASFSHKVYAALRKVPAGKVTPSRDLAHAGGSSASRAVGQAMRTNPFAPVVPCHRVVKSTGEIGGFSGSPKLSSKKVAMLRAEGIVIKDGKVLNFERVRYRF